MIFHESRLSADDSHEYRALFVISKKRQTLKLSSAAKCRLRFKGDSNLILNMFYHEELYEP